MFFWHGGKGKVAEMLTKFETKSARVKGKQC